jgi:predicted esterase
LSFGQVHVAAFGTPLDAAGAAVILVHGRGGTATDMLHLARDVALPGVAFLAPQAPRGSWYPFSFLAPLRDNEPDLSAALDTVGSLFDQVSASDIPADRVALLGFSQGACLVLEFTARNARRYGAVLGLSGGLIGPRDTPRGYDGSLADTPVFLGCSDVDPHIPVERVTESASVLEALGARVDVRIYPRMAHTVNRDEIEATRALLQRIAPVA